MFERLKNWIQGNKKIAGLLAAVLAALFYYIYKMFYPSAGTTGAETAPASLTSGETGQDIFTPPAGAPAATVQLPAINPSQYYDLQSQIESQNRIAATSATSAAQAIRDLETNRQTNVLLNTYLQGGVGSGFAGGFNQSVLNQGGYQTLAQNLAGVAPTAQPLTVSAMTTGTDAGGRVTIPSAAPGLLPTTTAGQIGLVQKIAAKPTEPTGTTNLGNAITGFLAGGPVGAAIGGLANNILGFFKRWF
jgi:hypothetical protein